MHEHISDREGESLGAERFRERGRKDQAGKHEREQEEPDWRPLGVEPIGDPRSVNPDPPHRQEQQRNLGRAVEREGF